MADGEPFPKINQDVPLSLQNLTDSVRILTDRPFDDQEQRTNESRWMDEQIHGLEKYHKLRDSWSTYLKVLLFLSALFQGVLIAMVGSSQWKFTNHEVFLDTVAGEMFLQIAGLGYIVVRCLFPSDGKKSTDKVPKVKPEKGKTETR